MTLKSDLACAINPAIFAKKLLHFTPDLWQEEVLTSKTGNIILNCSRQAGKSTIAAVLSLHYAIYKPGSLVLLVSPSLRQSAELYKKVYEMAVPLKLILKDDTAHELSVKGGGRVVSLPASEGTIRGFSSVDLVVEDESARVNDELHNAVKPMIAVSKGRFILMSTPYRMKGHYYDIWNDKVVFTDYKRIEVPATKIDRISPEFLEQEKRGMGSRIFSREYMCQFINEADTPMFYREWFEIVPSFPRGGKSVRCWDLAATAPRPGKDPDYTVGAKVTKLNGIYYISNIRRTRATPKPVEDLIKQTALLDELPVRIRMEQEPGSSGKNTIDHYAREVLDGFVFKGVPSSGDKSMRAAPFAAAAEAGNVKIVSDGSYDVRALLDELANFPQGDHDDQVDAISGAFEELNKGDPNRFLIMHTGKERY